jgi:hypothetical protein
MGARRDQRTVQVHQYRGPGEASGQYRYTGKGARRDQRTVQIHHSSEARLAQLRLEQLTVQVYQSRGASEASRQYRYTSTWGKEIPEDKTGTPRPVPRRDL